MRVRGIFVRGTQHYATRRKGMVMFVHGVPREELDRLADQVGLRLTNGRAAGSLRLRHAHYWKKDVRPWQAYSPHRVRGEKDRLVGVCWDGYMAFFSAVYREYEHATIKTSLAHWDNGTAYFATVHLTPRWNIDIRCACESSDKKAAINGTLDRFYSREQSVRIEAHNKVLARRTERDIAKARAIMAS